jgi:hypothetical protein
MSLLTRKSHFPAWAAAVTKGSLEKRRVDGWSGLRAQWTRYGGGINEDYKGIEALVSTERIESA